MLNFYKITFFYFYKRNEGKIYFYIIRINNFENRFYLFFKVMEWLLFLKIYGDEDYMVILII